MRKNENKLSSVLFSYSGSREAYDEFLQTVVHDYLAEEIPQLSPDIFIGKVELPTQAEKEIASEKMM